MRDVHLNPLAAEQARRNRARDGAWELSAGHRRHLTERVVALAPPHGGRLCVLGAGNVNDLDLAALGGAFPEIHLVDVDAEALERGAARQLSAAISAVRLHGGIDLTGIWKELVENRTTVDWPSAVCEELVARAAEPGPFDLPGPFDVVVSAGLVSQLIEAITKTVPHSARCFWDLLLAVRTGHLRLAARLTAPGGRMLLASDFVSSATCPELDQTAAADLAALAERLAAQRNFFHGLNPLFLPTLYATDPVLSQLVSEVRQAGYWLWRQRARTYAVFALEARRSAVS